MKLERIDGNKVRLRPITLDDTPLIVKWRNNPRVQKNFIFRVNFTNEMHTHWFKTKIAAGEVIQYIIEEKATSRPIGSVYFRDVDLMNRSAEYGIFIGEDDAVGNGFGSEVTKLFVDYGFDMLHLHRISLRLLESNDIAYKSYVAAGFQKDGVFRDMVLLDGMYTNIIFMSILENERKIRGI